MAMLVAPVKRLLAGSSIFLACLFATLESFSQIVSYGDPLTNARPGMDTAVRRWKSWNILLNPGLSRDARANAIISVERHINEYLRGLHSDWHANFDVFFCPCDSSLYNLGASPVDGVGNAVVPPSGGPNPPIPSGDIVAVSNNNTIRENVENPKYKIDSNRLIIPVSASSDKILAIIDTGLDSTKLSPEIRPHIWRARNGQLELFNYVTTSQSQFRNYFDDYFDRHGSAVAAVAIKAMSTGALPHLMILKALNSENRGSTFTVNCALSYAIQNHADLINMSLGYYESTNQIDNILREYLRKCATNKIMVFVAGGNLLGTHDYNLLCNHGTALHNQLKPGRMFYPACFSASMNNVISIVGLSDLNGSCFYQNCSNKYVTLGVLNQPGCCKYALPFFAVGYEGSSFATPAVAGMTMRKFIDGVPTIQQALGSIIQRAGSLNHVVKNGQYVKYTGNIGSF